MDPMDSFDDTVCARCGRALPAAPTPGSWADSGFCDHLCFLAHPGNAQLVGECAVTAARIPGRHGGPGFESDVVREWQAGAGPQGPVLLTRWLTQEDQLALPHNRLPNSWVWRLWSGGHCWASRLTAIGRPATERD